MCTGHHCGDLCKLIPFLIQIIGISLCSVLCFIFHVRFCVQTVRQNMVSNCAMQLVSYECANAEKVPTLHASGEEANISACRNLCCKHESLCFGTHVRYHLLGYIMLTYVKLIMISI